MKTNRIKGWLTKASPAAFSIYTIIAAFSAYSCMYAFRKPFAVATFNGIQFWGVDYKILLITSQVVGYALSKFIGIKIVSEMSGKKRALGILILVGMAEAALFFFAVVKPPVNIIFLFLNGLPLGMVWGLVFSYLEGRKTTELLGAGLCISFIFSSGFVKSAGKFLMVDLGVSPFWMPFYTGLLFSLPLVFFVWMLNQVPPPSDKDIEQRTKRVPMDRQARFKFFLRFAPALIMLILVYVFLTAFRDFRDNFAAEIWKTLGYGKSPEIFTITEIPISLAVIVVMGSVMFIKNNNKALMINHVIVFIGLLLVVFATMGFEHKILGPVVWMTLVGLGLYLGYVPFNSIFFERLIAAFRHAANVGFLIYLADSFGYLGSVLVMFYKNFGFANESWLRFFINGAYVMSFIGMVLIIGSMIYFQMQFKKQRVEASEFNYTTA